MMIAMLVSAAQIIHKPGQSIMIKILASRRLMQAIIDLAMSQASIGR